MFKSYNFKISNNYLQNFKKESQKKKRPLSKHINKININELHNNINFTNNINKFSNTKNRFYILNYEKESVNKYIKNDQQYNNIKKELLNNKGLGKDNYLKQINQFNDKKFDYFLKNNEKKANLIPYNKNKMPIKMLELGKNKKEPKLYLKKEEDNETSESEDSKHEIEKHKYDVNNYIPNQNIKINDIMIKNSMNIKKDDIFIDDITEFKEKKNEKIFTNLKINKNQKIEIQAVNKLSKNLIEFEKELKKRELEIKEREKEFNNKITFLEDKENMLEKEFEAHENLKKENIYLKQRNMELEKEIKEKEHYNNQIQELMKANNEENKNVKQENVSLRDTIKEMEEEISQLKNSNIKPTKLKLKDVLFFYKKPTLIGLDNIGATCFMNSTLQCLSQTKALTNYFLINKDKINHIKLKEKSECKLSPVYLELIQKLWDKNGSKSFSPYNFMNTIEKINPLFKTGEAGDAKDFIIFVLEQLHNELKKPVKYGNNNNNIILNQYDKKNAFNYFMNDFKNNCSIISDLFFGFNETTNECLNCKSQYKLKGLNNPICYNYGIFNCLIFPLEEVKNMKNNSFNKNNIQIQNNEVSLYDCFLYNQKNDYFTEENKNYCNICKQLYDSMYTSKIFVSPIILVIILNRGRGNIYDVKLNFSEEIDITQFVLEKDCPQLIYNLYGVITHIGQSGPNAHFVASCKSPIDNQWYRYNDSIVNPITNINNEIINFGVPYILFYQKNIDKK